MGEQLSMLGTPLPKAPTMERWAEIEPPYRWLLGRRWSPGKTLAWVMLNPSTADGTDDDPTMRKVVGFSSRQGYGACIVANAFPYQATDPSDLKRALKKDADLAIGPSIGSATQPMLRADEKILEALVLSSAVVLAWGGHCPVSRAKAIVTLLGAVAKPVLALGYTKDGHPLHPLMQPYAAELRPFERTGVLAP